MSSEREVLHDPVTQAYLNELGSELDRLSPGARSQVLDQVAEHIRDAALDASARGEKPDVADILRELGDPRTIAMAAQGRDSAGTGMGTSAVDRLSVFLDSRKGMWWTIATTAVASYLVPFAGWIAAMVMVWVSPRWSRTAKIVATLIVPVGVLLFLYAPWGTNLLFFDGGNLQLLLYVAPLLTAIWLLFRTQRRAE